MDSQEAYGILSDKPLKRKADDWLIEYDSKGEIINYAPIYWPWPNKSTTNKRAVCNEEGPCWTMCEICKPDSADDSADSDDEYKGVTGIEDGVLTQKDAPLSPASYYSDSECEEIVKNHETSIIATPPISPANYCLSPVTVKKPVHSNQDCDPPNTPPRPSKRPRSADSPEPMTSRIIPQTPETPYSFTEPRIIGGRFGAPTKDRSETPEVPCTDYRADGLRCSGICHCSKMKPMYDRLTKKLDCSTVSKSLTERISELEEFVQTLQKRLDLVTYAQVK